MGPDGEHSTSRAMADGRPPREVKLVRFSALWGMLRLRGNRVAVVGESYCPLQCTDEPREIARCRTVRFEIGICPFTQALCTTLAYFLKLVRKPFQAWSGPLISPSSFAFSSVTRSPKPSQANCVSR